MRQFVCSICGFIYDEAAGLPNAGFAPGTRWDDLPADWVCPLCKAPKSAFSEKKNAEKSVAEMPRNDAPVLTQDYSAGQLSVIFSNLAKGCEKQYRLEEMQLMNELSAYYSKQAAVSTVTNFETLLQLVQSDLDGTYAAITSLGTELKERGTLRALTWGEKVSRMLEAHLSRYLSEQDALIAKTNIYVCDICGFIYIGDEAPEICPVCKVPRFKISPVTRRS